MGDMPSWGSSLAGAEDEKEYRRADEFFVLLADALPIAATLRKVLAADYDTLVAEFAPDGTHPAYCDLRNEQIYLQARLRLIESGLHRITSTEDDKRLRDDAAEPNGDAAHIEAATD